LDGEAGGEKSPLCLLRRQLTSTPQLVGLLVKWVDSNSSNSGSSNSGSSDSGSSDSGRGKALLALRLVCARHPHALAQALERGLCGKLDRLVSNPALLEQAPYLRSCALCLLKWLAQEVHKTLGNLADGCHALALEHAPKSAAAHYSGPSSTPATQGATQGATQSPRGRPEQLDEGLDEELDEEPQGIPPSPPPGKDRAGGLRAAWSGFPAVAHLCSCGAFQDTFASQGAFLHALARIVDFATDAPLNVRGPADSPLEEAVLADKRRLDWAFAAAVGQSGGGQFGGRAELQRVALLCLQGLSRHPDAFAPSEVSSRSEVADGLARWLVPSVGRMLGDVGSQDTRANAASLLRLLLPPLLVAETRAHAMGQQLAGAVAAHVLPRLPALVRCDEEPIPHFCLNLLLDLSEAWPPGALGLSFKAAMGQKVHRGERESVAEAVLRAAEETGIPQLVASARLVAERAGIGVR